jgi:hypothetical protein
VRTSIVSAQVAVRTCASESIAENVTEAGNRITSTHRPWRADHRALGTAGSHGPPVTAHGEDRSAALPTVSEVAVSLAQTGTEVTDFAARSAEINDTVLDRPRHGRHHLNAARGERHAGLSAPN